VNDAFLTKTYPSSSFCRLSSGCQPKGILLQIKFTKQRVAGKETRTVLRTEVQRRRNRHREREREREREEGMAAKEEKRGGATEEEKSKTEIVQAEVARMKQLPPNSAYATHRLRVLDKMQQLLSKVPILLRAICL